MKPKADLLLAFSKFGASLIMARKVSVEEIQSANQMKEFLNYLTAVNLPSTLVVVDYCFTH